ncbi:hypothetical protein ABZ816_30880 [Actinosynnema sp. NPDC047251]|uniref:RICIN domain-containing protein n=1 Tax=Saccharothrix espanaensis TaxID=103731 RepID=UPI00030CA212|nr:hypothetical protein [Saccharothrix espanaensis]
MSRRELGGQPQRQAADPLRLRNYKSDRCLAVPSNQGQNGANVVNYDCILGYNDQWWQIWP